MADSVLDSTPAQFAAMFQEEPMVLVKVLREFWEEVKKSIDIHDWQPGSRVDYLFYDVDSRDKAMVVEGRLNRIKSGIDAAAPHSAAIKRVSTNHLKSITQMVDIFASGPSVEGGSISATIWFPDTIDLIEFELKQLQTAQSAIQKGKKQNPRNAKRDEKICKDFEQGKLDQKALASKYGLTKGRISQIVNKQV